MSVLFARIFYLLSAIIFLNQLPYILMREFNRAKFVGFAYPFGFFSEPRIAVFIISVILVGSVGFCLWKLDRVSRILVALLGSALLFTAFSFGKVNHTQHLWIMSLYAMIFFDVRKSFYQKPNLIVYDFIQTILLGTYFVSGLWKLRVWLGSGMSAGFQDSIANVIAYAIAEGNGPNPALHSLMREQIWIFSFAFLLALLFQLSTPLAIFIKKYRYAWGIFACVFHLATGYVMGVWFIEQTMAAFFFLVFVPLLEKDLKTVSA